MDSSWETSSEWYDKIVGKEGHYYHQQVILPNILRLLNIASSPSPRILDLGCGQGVLARELPKSAYYVGVDLSPALITMAKKYSQHTFFVGDAAKPLPIQEKNFTHAVFLLSLQNIADGAAALKNTSGHLANGGKLLLVLNHPCFRIPRQSSWGIDEKKKLQYRRIDAYYSSMEIPIYTQPLKNKCATVSYHHPLSTYTKWLHEAGLYMETIEEWLSNKKSSGAAARMENRCREEFPLFLAIAARKFV